MRTLRIGARFAFTLVAWGATTLGAQVAEPGARLRLTFASGRKPINGTYVRHLTDSLEFRFRDSGGAPLNDNIALSSISGIALSLGHHGAKPKTVSTAALIGAGTGAFLGFVSGEENCDRKRNCLISRPAGAAIGGIVFGLVGAVLGYIVGTISDEDWVHTSVEGWPVVVTPPSGIGLEWKVALPR